MYLHLGQNEIIPQRRIIGIFDLDNASWSHLTRSFVERAEREGRVAALGDDLPRSFVLAEDREGRPTVYLTPLSPAALAARSSPVRPTSPMAARSPGTGWSRKLDASAITAARSTAGSSSSNPPTPFI